MPQSASPASSAGPSPDQPGRRRLDRVIPALVALCLVLPLVGTLAALYSQTSASITFTDRERDGVTYLRPLVRLLSATVDAQSTAVAGTAVDGARLKAASHDVEAVNAQLGAVLSTTDRWGELRTRLDQLGGSGGNAQATYRAYSVVIDLELALVSRVGDTSNLILDPELDSYYVMDATLLRVPAILTDSGKVASLTGLAEASRADADRLAAAVSTSLVRSNMARIDDGLRKSFNATSSRTLASALLTPLDHLRDNITTFAPPSLEVGATPKTQDRATADLTRTAVRDAALGFETTGLTELDALLAARTAGQVGTQRAVLGSALAGLLLAAGLSVWAARRRAGRRADTPDPRVDLSFVDSPPGDLVGAGRSGPAAQGRS